MRTVSLCIAGFFQLYKIYEPRYKNTLNISQTIYDFFLTKVTITVKETNLVKMGSRKEFLFIFTFRKLQT